MSLPLALLAQILMAPPHGGAVRTPAPPSLDGRLDDAVWQGAPALRGFTQKYPNEGQPPTEPTTVRVLYDDEALYVAVECPQEHTPVVERLTRRDREVESDRVTVVVGSRSDRKTAYEFTVNASGSLVDALRFDDTERATEWDENWTARVARTRNGWTAELMIPLRILRFGGALIQSWDFQARRYISARRETDEWSYIPRSAAGEVSHYGYLDGLEGLKPTTPLEVRPFVLGRLRRLDPASTQVASGTDVKASAGLDLKWHPTPGLTLDAAVNPDFAQVEADQQVLNLTNFETYFPEKRPFFLEGTDVFTTPKQLVYTRRIGKVPASPVLREDAPFGERPVDLPTPSTIYGASKLTGTVAEGLQVGALQAVTAPNDFEVQSSSGARTRRLAEPLSAYQVLRLKRALPGNGYVGTMLTSTVRAEPSGRYPASPDVPGAVLCPDGNSAPASRRCFNDAYVGSVDWRWRSEGGDWVTGGQVIGSTLHEGPTRPVPDGTRVRPGDIGSGAYLFLNKEGGKHWVGDSYVEYAGRKLDYTDLGYTDRSNVYRWRVGLEYRELERWWHVLESRARLEYFGRTNLDGLWLGSGYQANVSAKFANFWEAFTELHWRPRYFDDREVGDGTALERAGLLGHEVELSSDPTRRVGVKAAFVNQLLSRGVAGEGEAGVLVRALPQFDVELLPTWVYSFGEPRFIAEGAAPGQYLFGRLRATSIGTVLRATYTFTPTLTLQAYGQLFLASGHYGRLYSYQSDPAVRRPVVRVRDLVPYGAAPAENPDFQEGALNLNVVLRWEYLLGSTVYAVYTRSQVPALALLPGEEARLSVNSVRRAPAADAFLLKLAYWWAPK